MAPLDACILDTQPTATEKHTWISMVGVCVSVSAVYDHREDNRTQRQIMPSTYDTALDFVAFVGPALFSQERVHLADVSFPGEERGRGKIIPLETIQGKKMWRLI